MKYHQDDTPVSVAISSLVLHSFRGRDDHCTLIVATGQSRFNKGHYFSSATDQVKGKRGRTRSCRPAYCLNKMKDKTKRPVEEGYPCDGNPCKLVDGIDGKGTGEYNDVVECPTRYFYRSGVTKEFLDQSRKGKEVKFSSGRTV